MKCKILREKKEIKRTWWVTKRLILSVVRFSMVVIRKNMFSSLLSSSQACGKNPRGYKKKTSQSKLMVTLCLKVNRSNSVAPSTLLSFIHELKMSNLGLSAIITYLWCVVYTLLGRGGDMELDRRGDSQPVWNPSVSFISVTILRWNLILFKLKLFFFLQIK